MHKLRIASKIIYIQEESQGISFALPQLRELNQEITEIQHNIRFSIVKTLVLSVLKSNLKPYDQSETKFKVSCAWRKVLELSLPRKQSRISSAKAVVSQQATSLRFNRRFLIIILKKDLETQF